MEKAGKILKGIIDALFEKAEFRKGSGYHGVFNDWQKVMGQKLFQHSRPVEIKERFLLIEVDHPGWLQLIQMSEKAIIKRVNSMYPDLDVGFIKMRLMPATSSDPLDNGINVLPRENTNYADKKNENNGHKGVEEEGIEDKTIEERKLIEAIRDPSLKESLLRLFREMHKKQGV